MTLWVEKFAALSRDVDRSDTSRHIADPTCDVSRSVHSVAPPLEPVQQPGRDEDKTRSGLTTPFVGGRVIGLPAYGPDTDPTCDRHRA